MTDHRHGGTPPSGSKRTARVTVPKLRRMKERGERITMLTAYDATFARMFEEADIDLLLVGDSLGMVVQGPETERMRPSAPRATEVGEEVVRSASRYGNGSTRAPWCSTIQCVPAGNTTSRSPAHQRRFASRCFSLNSTSRSIAAIRASVCPGPTATCGRSVPRASKVFARRYGEIFRAGVGPITFQPRLRISARASASCVFSSRSIASHAPCSSANHCIGSSSFTELRSAQRFPVK